MTPHPDGAHMGVRDIPCSRLECYVDEAASVRRDTVRSVFAQRQGLERCQI